MLQVTPALLGGVAIATGAMAVLGSLLPFAGSPGSIPPTRSAIESRREI